MAYLFLFGAMVLVMLVRVAPPLGVRIEGEAIGCITLGWKERVRLQRTNVYAIGAVLLLVTATSNVPLVAELAAILGVVAVLAVPVRYVITSRGIAMNRTVFREWSEFDGIETDSSGIKLLPVPGVRPFRLVLSPAKSAPVRHTLQKFVRPVRTSPGQRLAAPVQS